MCVKCLSHCLPVYRKGLTDVVRYYLMTAEAREAGNIDPSASLRERNEWAPRSQGGDEIRAKEARRVRIPLTISELS